jgi:IS5 family transposase
MPCQIIPFPQELRPQLPTVVGNVDYLTFRQRLEQIDALLRDSGTERDFVQRALNQRTSAPAPAPAPKMTAVEQGKFQQRSRRALRCTLLRTLLQEDYRGFSCQLAGNPLYQWFCQVDAMDQVRVPSKSEVQRFAHWLPAPEMRAVIEGLLRGAMQTPDKLGLKEALDLEEYFLDSTCLKANVHFPTDWVLLRDGVRTLMKATLLIRQAGLRERMEAPEEFLRRMNQLSITMSQQGRRAGSKKGRKRVLRQMKKLVSIVRAHAQRHRDLLDQEWERTDWTRPQTEQILRRLDGVLELLPRAQKQAHERIIGGRPVPNSEKILSLYDTDVRVIVRGKAGAEVEFGNTLLLGESRQGIILDFQLYRESAPADSSLLSSSLRRVEAWSGRRVGAAATDRGFTSAANRRELAATGIFDALCPRDPAELTTKFQDEKFARLQRRRAQTEGRISILKHSFLGRPLRAKGFTHRELALAWGVLTHNLWLLARLKKARKQPVRRPAEPLRQAA